MLYDDALLGLLRRHKHLTNDLFEDIPEALLRERRALEVLDRADLLGHVHALLRGDGRLVLLAQLGHRVRVGAQVELRPHADDRHARAEGLQLRVPLLLCVLVRGTADEREGDEEDVGLRVAEGAQLIVDRRAVHHHVDRVVVEDGRGVTRDGVYSWEGVSGVRVEEAGLADGSIADDHALHFILPHQHGTRNVMHHAVGQPDAPRGASGALRDDETPNAHVERLQPVDLLPQAIGHLEERHRHQVNPIRYTADVHGSAVGDDYAKDLVGQRVQPRSDNLCLRARVSVLVAQPPREA
eukprot:scaffold76587_cov73-Phaeocystis_antarctica.AAC.3